MTYIKLAEQRHRTEYDDITQQLAELLEVIEAGDIDTAKEWLRIAIDRRGTRANSNRGRAFTTG